MNIRFCNEEALSHMTALLSYGYLPDITALVSRILDLLMTCIDHVLFIKLVGEMLNIVYLITK